MKRLIPALMISMVNAAWGSEQQRSHDAHVHGHAKMTIAALGDGLEIELQSPAMNIVGFEHQANSDQDRQAVEAAREFLAKADGWIALDESSVCTLQTAKVESELLGEHDHEEHKDEQDNDHEEHKDEHDHDHDHEGEGSDQHSEFHVTVSYQCSDMKLLSSVSFSGLFTQYPGIVELDVEWVTDTRQSATELDSKNVEVNLN